jgi:hypothetical protein
MHPRSVSALTEIEVAGKEPNWIPTDPARRFELMFRLYGPTKALFDKTWKLPDVEKVLWPRRSIKAVPRTTVRMLERASGFGGWMGARREGMPLRANRTDPVADRRVPFGRQCS